MSALRHSPELFDPGAGDKAIRVAYFEPPAHCEPKRTNYFTIYWIATGAAQYFADAGNYTCAAGTLLFFNPYQHLRIVPQSAITGSVIHFHANFLCVETFHAESGCAGVLFNDPYHPPGVPCDRASRREIPRLVAGMHAEALAQATGYEEMLLAQLKMLLILATRQKSRSALAASVAKPSQRHPVLSELKQQLETHYQTLHSPADYARLLHMSPKTLGRIVREQLGKSLTDLIRERVITHAKWQLLHTLKPVKEVAREVGFQDELYFSRMFKKATGYSPRFFREFETQIRGGSNLSMLSFPAPIQHSPANSDNAVDRS